MRRLQVVADKMPEIYRSGTTLNIWLERENAQLPPQPPLGSCGSHAPGSPGSPGSPGGHQRME